MGKAETQLTNVVLDYLALRGVFAWRNNSGAVKTGKRFIRYGKAGSPDIIGVVPVVITPKMVGQTFGRFIGAECKVGRGKSSPAQHAFAFEIQAAGGLSVLCRQLEDIKEALGDV